MSKPVDIPIKINVAGHHSGADDIIEIGNFRFDDDNGLTLDIRLPKSFGLDIYGDDTTEYRFVNAVW